MDRYRIAAYMGCKSCENCHNFELQYYTGNVPDGDGKFCNLSMDTRINLILWKRTECADYQVEKEVERDTTYPGATYAPHDNNHPGLKPDNTDIEDYEKPLRCLGQWSAPPEYIQKNDWDILYKECFDRNRKGGLPNHTRILELLHNSFIPEIAYRIGLPPKGSGFSGFDRGLWQHRKEGKYNWALEKNKSLRSKMKKIIMVYLYHKWFKELPEDHKEGIMIALEDAKDFSLAKDLFWWVGTAFKDPTLQVLYPNPEDDVVVEFVRMNLMDKALEAEMLAKAGVTSYELDLECLEYDKILDKYNRKVDEFGDVTDSEGYEIY